MLKNAAAAALAFALVACASEEEAPASPPAPIPGAPVIATTPEAPPAPCPPLGSSGSADGSSTSADAGPPPLAPSPVERCEGRYSGRSATGAGAIGAGWLRRSPEGCKWGETYVLRPDNSVVAAGSGDTVGTWKGDAFYFFVEDGRIPPSGHRYVFSLLADADPTE